ncbi:MAG: hypothetical protein ACO24D_19930, partial [bacterium]
VTDKESEDVITLLGPLSKKLSMRSPFDLDMANDDEVLQSKLMIRHLGSAEKVLVSVSFCFGES